jgi:3-oxoadipate enol-lactonase
VTTAPAPVVLLHGLMGSRLSWAPQVDALGGARAALAWDLPGYGDTPPVGASFAEIAAAVANRIDSIGAGGAHLVGHSFGGMVAQYVAAWHPGVVRSLTLVSTSPKFGLDGTEPDAWRAARLSLLDTGATPQDFAPRVLKAIAGPNISQDALDAQITAAGPVSSDALRASIDVLVTHDSRSLLNTIAAPTLVLVGALDDETPVAYARALADGIAGAALAVIDGAGHLLPAEAPDRVSAAIAAHVAACEVRA